MYLRRFFLSFKILCELPWGTNHSPRAPVSSCRNFAKRGEWRQETHQRAQCGPTHPLPVQRPCGRLLHKPSCRFAAGHPFHGEKWWPLGLLWNMIGMDKKGHAINKNSSVWLVGCRQSLCSPYNSPWWWDLMPGQVSGCGRIEAKAFRPVRPFLTTMKPPPWGLYVTVTLLLGSSEDCACEYTGFVQVCMQEAEWSPDPGVVNIETCHVTGPVMSRVTT